MILPSLSTGLVALLSFASLSASAARTVSSRQVTAAECSVPAHVKNVDASVGVDVSGLPATEAALRTLCGRLYPQLVQRDVPKDALSVVTGLKDTVGDILAQVTALGDKLDKDVGSEILGQLTTALTSAISAAHALPVGAIAASVPTDTSALGTKVALAIVVVLKDVFHIVARLGVAVPTLAPLLLAVDGLLVALLKALAPVVGALLANVSALVKTAGDDVGDLISKLGLGLTSGLLTLV